MKIQKHILHNILFLSVILFLSCRKDFDKPTWNTDILTPIMNSSLSINNLISDSLIKIAPDGFVTLVYQTQMYQFTIDSLFQMPDTTTTYIAKLDSIKLGVRSISRRISLGEIAQNAGIIGNIIIGLNGRKAPIPPLTAISSDEIEINANDLFQTITLKAGYMDVTLKNGLPITISNLVFLIRNKNNLDTVAYMLFPQIPAGATVTDSTSLAGKTIDGNLLGKIINFDSPGTGNDSVLIDTNNAMIATLTVRDLDIYAATAIFPEQDVINKGDNLPFKLPGILLTDLIVRSGFVTVETFNTCQDPAYFTYRMPNATQNGIQFIVQNTITGALNGQPGHLKKMYDFSGYTLNLRGAGPYERIEGDLNGNKIIDKDTVNTILQRLLVHIDSTGHLIPLSLSDSFFVDCGVIDIIPEYGLGYFGRDTFNITSFSNFGVFKNINNGSLSLENVNVKLTIENQIGIEMDLIFNEISCLNSRTGKIINLNSSVITNPLTISKPNNPNSITIPVTPTTTNIELNSANSNINEMLENLPDQIGTSFSFILNPRHLPEQGLNNFIYYNSKMGVFLNVEIPLAISANQIILSDTIDISISEKTIENINQGVLTLYTDNGFPFNATIQLYLLNEQKQVFDSLLNIPATSMSASINVITGKVISPKKTKITIPVSNTKLQNLVRTKQIKVIAKLNTQPQGMHVKIYDNYSIKFNLVGDFNYHINLND